MAIQKDLTIKGATCNFHRLDVMKNANRITKVQIGTEKNAKGEDVPIYLEGKLRIVRINNYISKTYYDSEIQAGRIPEPVGFTDHYITENLSTDNDIKHSYIELTTIGSKTKYDGGTEI